MKVHKVCTPVHTAEKESTVCVQPEHTQMRTVQEAGRYKTQHSMYHKYKKYILITNNHTVTENRIVQY